MDEVVSKCENTYSTSGPTMLDSMTHRGELYAEVSTVGTRVSGTGSEKRCERIRRRKYDSDRSKLLTEMQHGSSCMDL